MKIQFYLFDKTGVILHFNNDMMAFYTASDNSSYIEKDYGRKRWIGKFR